jgi:hypothetical protein
MNNVEKYCRAWQTTDNNMAHVHCMLDENKQTNKYTLSHYVIIIAFPLQQWLQERASLLRLYVQCLYFQIQVAIHIVTCKTSGTFFSHLFYKMVALLGYIIHFTHCVRFVIF